MITNGVFANQLEEIKNLTITARPQVTKEPVFNVILNTREIEIPAAFKNLAVYGEHRAETIWFALDRYFDGVDLSQKKAGIQFQNSQVEMLLPIDFKKVNDDNPDELLLGWQITSDVTSVSGRLDFGLKFFETDDVTKTAKYILNTKMATVNILTGLNVTDESQNLNPPLDTLTTLVNTISELYQNQQTTNIDYNQNIKYETLPTINSQTLIGNKTTADLRLNYPDLLNLPKINGHVLTGDMTDASLGIKVDVDDALKLDSVNPVQNKVVTSSINNLNTNMTSVTAKANANAAEIEAIKEELSNMTFIPIEITEFRHELGFIENGRVLEGIDLYWECSKTPISLILNKNSVSPTENPIKVEQEISQYEIFKLVASDGKTEAKAETQVEFVDGIYYGVGTNQNYDNAFINNLEQLLTNEKTITIEAQANLDQNIFIAAPAAFSCEFTVGGFSGGFHVVEAFEYENQYGYKTDYKIYKSDNVNLGKTKVTITLS